MNDRENRSDRLRKRFDRGGDGDPDGAGAGGQTDSRSASSTSAETAESDAGSSSETDEESVKDRPSVLMYLPEETRRELDIRFDELNARHKREHGEPLEKNRDYYPAVIRAGLEGERIEDVLEL
jgi:hypothetical protein